jgi:hypothetical protein
MQIPLPLSGIGMTRVAGHDKVGGNDRVGG